MLLSTPLPASSSFARLLPYAKAHDKLQLALLSLEVEEAKLDSAQEQLERLRHEEASIKSQLNLLAEARALLANKHGSNSPDEHLNDGNDVIRISVSLVSEKDHRLHQNVSGFYDQWERKMLDSLAKLRKKIEQCLIAECESEKRISYKPELLRFIEELYSSVFDGVTPDFPHEDRVEELVELAELALEHKKMIQSSVLYEPGLAKLDGSNIKAHQAIFGLELGTNTYIQQCSSNMVTHYFPEIQLWKHCEFVGVTFAALRDAIRKYLEKRPDSLLLQFGSTVKDIVPLVDADSLYNFIVRAGVSQDGKYEVKRKVNLLLKGVTEISELLRLSIHINEKRHLNAQNAVDAATVILKLRRHQLASIRCQILDFIVNPQNCLPEEDLIGNPPRYSPAISYGDFTRLDPTVPQLLERAEGCPREDHVKAAVESRLSRIKRMMHAGAIRVECFVAPEYVQTNDLQSAQKHPESIDSRETLAYQDILALEKIAGNARCAEEAVYADLDLLTVQARRCGLLPLVRPRAII